MGGIAESRTWDALLTTTLSNYRQTLVDNIFDQYPLLSYLNGKLGITLRGQTVKRLIGGGESIVEHLLYEKNSTANSYSGAESLDVTLQEGLTIARYNWKQYSAAVGITGLEKRANNGEAAMIRLLEAKTKQAEMSLRDKMSVDAFSDGTGNGNKALTGLGVLVSATATVGGLDVATYPWWESYSRASAGSFATNGRDYMTTAFNTITFGNDKPDVIITDQTTFEYFEKSLTALERYERTTNSDVAKVGFTNLTFKGVPVLFDRDCTSGYMYFLNSNAINFVVHQDADFTTGPFVTWNKIWGHLKDFALNIRQNLNALIPVSGGSNCVAFA